MFKPVYNADMPVRFTDSAGKPVLHTLLESQFYTINLAISNFSQNSKSYREVIPLGS